HHNIDREVLSVRERMSNILDVIRIGDFCEFATLFNPEEGKQGVVVTFLAILELCKESLIDIVQSESFAPIYLKTRSNVHEDSVNHSNHQQAQTQNDGD
ncbi:MAG: segregation/condensation protein A, partial [Gammaproteobacteria bacterium]|nr:segregation/condensation protein A [Gammaproteobacteria bacterium]